MQITSKTCASKILLCNVLDTIKIRANTWARCISNVLGRRKLTKWLTPESKRSTLPSFQNFDCKIAICFRSLQRHETNGRIRLSVCRLQVSRRKNQGLLVGELRNMEVPGRTTYHANEWWCSSKCGSHFPLLLVADLGDTALDGAGAIYCTPGSATTFKISAG